MRQNKGIQPTAAARLWKNCCLSKRAGHNVESGILPNITLIEEGTMYIGVCEAAARTGSKKIHKILYYNLLTIGKLNAHLAEIDRQARMCFGTGKAKSSALLGTGMM